MQFVTRVTTRTRNKGTDRGHNLMVTTIPAVDAIDAANIVEAMVRSADERQEIERTAQVCVAIYLDRGRAFVSLSRLRDIYDDIAETLRDLPFQAT